MDYIRDLDVMIERLNYFRKNSYKTIPVEVSVNVGEIFKPRHEHMFFVNLKIKSDCAGFTKVGEEDLELNSILFDFKDDCNNRWEDGSVKVQFHSFDVNELKDIRERILK